MFRYIFFLFLLGALVACSSTDTETKSSVSNKDDPGSFFTGKSESGITLGDLTRTSNKDFAGIPVNALLWRASLDVIDFMPLSSVNYSGGIIITDWYSENQNPNESIKITIRFLTNEVRSDALEIKIFNRKCLDNLLNCRFTQTDGVLVTELKKEILKKAAIYKENNKDKK